MGYRKVFRKVKMKDLMPANNSHIGYVAHDRSVWAEKVPGFDSFIIQGNPFFRW